MLIYFEFLVFFIIGKNNPNVYKTIINIEIIIMALTAFIFMIIIFLLVLVIVLRNYRAYDLYLIDILKFYPTRQ